MRITDSPLAETVEQIGGFYLIDMADLDQMTEVCALLPDYYAVEIRPVIDPTVGPSARVLIWRVMTVAEETEDVFRDQWGRLLALLVAQFRRLDLAEDGLADAFAAAADRWPADGVPRNPAGWLLTAARRRILDRLRAEAVAVRKEPLLVVEARLTEEAQQMQVDVGEEIGDDRLRLIFLCAHPASGAGGRGRLSLRLVLGVSTADIARLFLVSEPTMAARLTRAKRKLAVAGAPFTLPDGPALEGRLAAATTAVYLAFTAGYAPGSGPDAIRVALAGEAIRLVRTLRACCRDRRSTRCSP